jgi:hypothetical protein
MFALLTLPSFMFSHCTSSLSARPCFNTTTNVSKRKRENIKERNKQEKKILRIFLSRLSCCLFFLPSINSRRLSPVSLQLTSDARSCAQNHFSVTSARVNYYYYSSNKEREEKIKIKSRLNRNNARIIKEKYRSSNKREKIRI